MFENCRKFICLQLVYENTLLPFKTRRKLVVSLSCEDHYIIIHFKIKEDCDIGEAAYRANKNDVKKFK